VLLLEGGTFKGAQIFSQEQESRFESCGERRELKLWILRKIFMFLSGQRPKGVGGVYLVPPSGPTHGPPKLWCCGPLLLHCCYTHPFLSLSLPLFIEITFYVSYAMLLSYDFLLRSLIGDLIKLVINQFMLLLSFIYIYAFISSMACTYGVASLRALCA
jgi:hypothetical protein